MEVTVPNFLMDAWDREGSFRSAFCDTYEAVTQAYEVAASDGRLPTTHDVVEEVEDQPSALHSALARGEGKLGATELARRYGFSRQHVWRVGKALGITIAPSSKSLARLEAEKFFEVGVTSPTTIIAALAAADPSAGPVHRNTISQWHTRWQREQG